MKASRKRPKGSYRWSFGLLLIGSTLMPTSVGYQDLAALIARQPAVTERWRAHLRNSAFGTVHATLSFPRPIGSSIPDPYFTQLAALDPRALDVTGSIPLPSPIEPQMAPPVYEFPTVQRRLKGDRLPLSSAPQAPVAPAPEPSQQPTKFKDQASLIAEPKAAPAPAVPETASEALPLPLARKGDRSAAEAAPATPPLEMTVDNAALDEAASATAKAGRALKLSGVLQRKHAPAIEMPVPVAEIPLPDSEKLTPVEDKPLRVAEKPLATPKQDAALKRAGATFRKFAQAKSLPMKRVPVEVVERVPEISAPPREEIPAREPATEIADLESQRADIHGSLALPAPPVAEAPKADLKATAQSAPAEPNSKEVDRFAVVDSLAQFAAPAPQSTRIYFGTHEIGFGKGSLQRWEPEEAPTVLAPPHLDPEIKRAALAPEPEIESETPGVTVAAKGEVTGEGRRPRTPSERLNLSGASRVKHEKCLANAIYFEARGEVERGQMAVAQVILNRAFSGYYPGNVCDVVYQNAHRHLACQFTFACDNVRDVVREPEAWETASRVARDALDGKFWLPEIGKATHYHATYVNPWWVRTMTKHARLGIHIFYRPKRWGDGEDMPVWGDRLDITGTLTPMVPQSDGDAPGKRAAAQPPKLRSIFDPVEEIKPGG